MLPTVKMHRATVFFKVTVKRLTFLKEGSLFASNYLLQNRFKMDAAPAAVPFAGMKFGKKKRKTVKKGVKKSVKGVERKGKYPMLRSFNPQVRAMVAKECADAGRFDAETYDLLHAFVRAEFDHTMDVAKKIMQEAQSKTLRPIHITTAIRMIQDEDTWTKTQAYFASKQPSGAPPQMNPTGF